ncbi:cytochrome c biogenesis protein ResB [Nocardiopsis ansamitocini]|uniref:Cytochrome c biosynthesis protein n=1 Tax=Nocardiopsis ansamitocini TaxID=1670832 RepID=A0A9W6UJU5_9ACTN|nr:cytochrome c biogenesis protein ResB [Nocardiopsis ansamitocini]GLU49219.1 cytochrome c biosynthesis protein [Nocardiopsis ansamitocini]
MTSLKPTAPASSDGPGSSAPRLSPLGWVRWAWRILTSMRTALILLFLLALGAIPGSLLPQRGVSIEQVQNYFFENPDLAPWLDRFFLFDVYSSPWYAAIYLLLFVSLTGCVLPRALAHYRLMRARPPKTPRRLDRMPYSATFSTDATPDEVLTQARPLLKGYRIEADTDSLSAEAGYLRETGNVLFHLALLALLVALAIGSFFGYRGNMLLVEGDSFANTLPSYDAFHPGHAVDPDAIEPFWLRLDDFEAAFVQDGSFSGQADSFSADVTYREAPGEVEQTHVLKVNHPLQVDGAQVYLLGHGYAPSFKVTDSRGDVVLDQPVPFLFRDTFTFTSDGVVKVPDSAPEQLGFTGVFLPSAATAESGDLVSDFPEARNPRVVLKGFVGDLGLDSGDSQSVYQLYAERMTQVGESPAMAPGDTWELPDGAGTIEFTGVSDYISLQVASNPSRVPALVSAIAAVVGLLGTLFVQPRRVWVRARPGADGRTVVEVAGLVKTEGAASLARFHELASGLNQRLR